MSLISQIREIFVAQHAVDFRKGVNGLLAECYGMNLDPYKGECVVFVHRSWRQIKVIFGDERGLFLLHRRFDGGALKATFAFLRDPSFVCVSQSEIAMLLDGNCFSIHTRAKVWQRSIRNVDRS